MRLYLSVNNKYMQQHNVNMSIRIHIYDCIIILTISNGLTQKQYAKMTML